MDSKLVSLEEAQRRVRRAQAAGERVVLCHGCFDIVHPGHVRHLREAARCGDRLLVTVSGDQSVRKGDGRPLIPQELRAENLAAFDMVDWVCVAPGPTAEEVLRWLRPDVYVKGREYEKSADPRFRAERLVVEEYGGRVFFTSGDVVFSSTALIAALEDSALPLHAQLRHLAAHPGLGREDLAPVLDRLAGRRVLVVGESIVDTYVLCDRPEVASESPVLTLRPLEYRHYDGGAAVIALHIAAMGGRPLLLTALPPTGAEDLRHRLHQAGVEVRALEVDRPLPEKQRFLVGAQKLVKLDLVAPLLLDTRQQERLIQMTLECAAGCDAATIIDYGLGLLTASTLTQMTTRLRPLVAHMTGDVSGRRSSLMAFRQMDLLCPSEIELRNALHEYDEGLTSAVWSLLQGTSSTGALVKMGAEGLIAFECREGAHEDPERWRQRLSAVPVPSFASGAVDELGCGDALLAAATLTLAAGGSRLAAAVIGSVAAAAEVVRLGNAVIGAADLRRGLRRLWEARLTCAEEPAACTVVPTVDQLRPAHA